MCLRSASCHAVNLLPADSLLAIWCQWLESAEACEGSDVLGAVAELEAVSTSDFDLRVLLVHDMEEALEKAASTKTAKALLCMVANAAVAGREAMASLQAEVDRATGARTDRSGATVARQLGMAAPRPLRVLLYVRQDSAFDTDEEYDDERSGCANHISTSFCFSPLVFSA